MQSEVLPTSSEWAKAIGFFMLNFGSLEHHTFCFLEKELSPEAFVSIRKRHLKDRMDWIGGYLEDKAFPEDKRQAFALMSEKIERLRVMRNVLAHGQFVGRYDPDKKECVLMIAPSKDLDMPENLRVTFSEICEALNILQEVLNFLVPFSGYQQDWEISFPENVPETELRKLLEEKIK
jgi:hypothetical protein